VCISHLNSHYGGTTADGYEVKEGPTENILL
jgi:hypothetical protein